jgi:hypothetical protein
VLDSSNRVVEPKNRQAQRKYRRQTNVTSGAVSSGTLEARQQATVDPLDDFADLLDDAEEPTTPVVVKPVAEPTSAPRGGLAAAIARSREVKQELEKTVRQRAQEQGLKKI